MSSLSALICWCAAALLAAGEVHQTLTPLEALGGPATGASTARIGQPVEWRIVSDDVPLARAGWEVPVAALEAAGWRLLDGPRHLDERTRVYTLCALDPGACATPSLAVALADGAMAEAAAATLEVLGELAEGEDAPRPAKGFRSVPDRAVTTPRVAGGSLVALGILGTGAAWFAARRRRLRDRASASAAPTGRTRLAALEQAYGAGALDPAALIGALGPLVRALVDEERAPQGASRAEALARAAALTDAEWVAALPATVPAAAAKIVDEAARVRFSGAAPTPFAARQLLDDALALAEQLGRGGQP